MVGVRYGDPGLAASKVLTGAIAISLCVANVVAYDGPPGDGPTVLSLSESRNRDLAAGQAHLYQVDLPAGTFAHVTVAQKGIDLAVTLSDASGAVLSEIDSPTAERGSESVCLLADESSRYSIRVHAPAESVPPAGGYAITFDTLRPATEQDAVRVAAERDGHAALQLWNEQTDDSMKLAIGRYEKAIAGWRTLRDRRSEADTLSYLGSLEHGTDQVAQAIERWKLERTIRRELGDKAGEAIAASNLGSAFDSLGNLKSALELYREARGLAAESGDPLAEGQALSESGRVLVRMGRLTEAETVLNEALPLLESKVDAIQMGQVYGTLGSIAYKRSDRALTRSRYEKSLEYFTMADDASGMSSALLFIGRTIGSEGRREEALVYFQRALELSTSVDDTRGIVTILSAIGSTYDYLGDRDEAIVNYTRALADATKLGDRLEIGNALNNIGLATAVRNDYARRDVGSAARSLQRAIATRRAIGDRPGVGDALLNLGQVWIRSGLVRQAIPIVRRALEIHRGAGNRANEAYSLKLLGDAYAARRDWRRAMVSYEAAQPLAREYGFAGAEAPVLLSIARTERGRGKLAAARSRIEEAIRIVESVRSGIASRDLRSSYISSVWTYYAFYIDLLMQMHAKDPSGGFDGEAFRISERGRARSLLDLLQASGAEYSAISDPATAARLRDAEVRLDAATRRQVASGSKDAAERAAATAEVEAVAREYEQLRQSANASDPRFASLTDAEPFTLAEIQKEVLDDGTVLVEYAHGETRSYAWVVTPTSIRSFTLGPRASIESAAREVHRLAQAPPSSTARGMGLAGSRPASARRLRREQAIQDFVAAARRLGRLVLDPLAAYVGTKRMLVVADGALAYVPFAALPEPGSAPGSYSPLVEKREVVGAPSASTVGSIRRERGLRPAATRSVAVIADPVFDVSDERIARTDGGDAGETSAASNGIRGLGLAHVKAAAKDFSVADPVTKAAIRRLPATRREAEAIEKLAPVESSMVALDFAANRSLAMRADLADYRIVHFATHGFANSSRPALSGLVLSLFDENGVEQPGFLRLGDVFGMRLGADLVVLSACETGLGKQMKGDGIVGLTRGFMYAGSPRVVVSLWSVSDRATADLMTAFYDRMLAKGMSPSAALRAAQLELVADERTRAPFYWGAFVLQGDWR